MQTAIRFDSVTCVQPEMAVPFEVKLTVPVGCGGPAGPMVAVMVTDCPDGGRIGRAGDGDQCRPDAPLA